MQASTLKHQWKDFPLDLKIGILIVASFLSWAILWPLVCLLTHGTVSYNPEVNIELELLKPFEQGYLLGTDLFGRSLFAVISHGLLYSLGVSCVVSAFALVIGVSIGVWAENSYPWTKAIFEKAINLMFVLPGILVAIVFMSYFGSSKWVLIFSLVVTNWAGYARITRGELKQIMGRPYVESAQALGIGSISMFFTHIFPFLLPQLMIHFILGLSGIVISEATLSFLGMSAGKFSWGQILSMGKNVLLECPSITIIMSLVMGLFILGLNLMGDGLRDFLDPKSKNRK